MGLCLTSVELFCLGGVDRSCLEKSCKRDLDLFLSAIQSVLFGVDLRTLGELQGRLVANMRLLRSNGILRAAGDMKTQRHHFIPEFFLKAWHEDGRLWRYCLSPRGLDVQRKPAKRVAYEVDLNTLHAAPDPGELERWLAAQVDDPASMVIRRLRRERREVELSQAEGEALIRFLFSLLERRPCRVQERERVGIEVLEEMLEDAQAARIVELHGEAFLHQHVNVEDRSRAVLRQFLDTEHTSSLEKARFMLFEIDPCQDERFATSDDPVIRFGRAGEMYAAGLAIDPSLLLLVHPKAWEFTQSDTLALAAVHDLKLIMQKPSAVFARRELENNTTHFGLRMHYRKLMEEYLIMPSWM